MLNKLYRRISKAVINLLGLSTTRVDMTFELQRIIFETAAELDGRTAYDLILVAKYVHDWIFPLLHEQIVIRDNKAARSLEQAIKAYSPSIRRLALIHGPGNDIIRHSVDILPLSHLALIGDTHVQGGFCFISSYLMHKFPFPNSLTLIAVSHDQRSSSYVSNIFDAVPRLKCLALLFPRKYDLYLINQFVQDAKRHRDPRIFILTRYGHPSEWDRKDGVELSKFWSIVENLSRDRFICDKGHRWDEEVINNFRDHHPGVSLFGD